MFALGIFWTASQANKFYLSGPFDFILLVLSTVDIQLLFADTNSNLTFKVFIFAITGAKLCQECSENDMDYYYDYKKDR